METWRGLFRCSRGQLRICGQVTVAAALWLWLQVWIAAEAWRMPGVDMHAYIELCVFFAACDIGMALAAYFDLVDVRADIRRMVDMELVEQRALQRRLRATPVEIGDADTNVISLDRYRRPSREREEPTFAPIIEID